MKKRPEPVLILKNANTRNTQQPNNITNYARGAAADDIPSARALRRLADRAAVDARRRGPLEGHARVVRRRRRRRRIILRRGVVIIKNRRLRPLGLGLAEHVVQERGAPPRGGVARPRGLAEVLEGFLQIQSDTVVDGRRVGPAEREARPRVVLRGGQLQEALRLRAFFIFV